MQGQGVPQAMAVRQGREDVMYRYLCVVAVVATVAAGCSQSVNVEQERSALLALDREWSQTTKDTDKFLSYFAPDASAYPQGMPVATGTAAIREAFTQMSAMPGFSISWTPTKADVSAAGDLGYTAGTYDMTMAGASEKGKYITTWKKQPDGAWKVVEDIFNADTPPHPSPALHVMAAPSDLKWGDAPPSLPPGAKMAVVSGDPSQAVPFVIRAQMPAGYRIPPHWHPTDEHVTVLSGTVALGMGETFDQAALKNVPTGGYFVAPAETRHFFAARTAATIQVHGMGPFAINYVNPADDPSRQSQ
jgi:ketosteroid isomerase-like protein/quercetin dioxygenase-like cupin family protein